jgi:hypothetical protein
VMQSLFLKYFELSAICELVDQREKRIVSPTRYFVHNMNSVDYENILNFRPLPELKRTQVTTLSGLLIVNKSSLQFHVNSGSSNYCV